MFFNLKVSVIICSLDGNRGGNVSHLLNELAKQSYPEFEVLVVQGFSPCSKAHNEGAGAATGEILVFFDDDIQLGSDTVIESLVKVIATTKNVGIAGASRLIPDNSNWFQKRCTMELFREESPIATELTKSDMVTHAGMSIKKSLYNEVGGEKEELLRNDDVYLRYMVREKGCITAIVPNTWVIHPPPRDIIAFVRGHFNNGIANAHDYKYFPEYIYNSPLDYDQLNFPEKASKKSSLFLQIIRNFKILLYHLSHFHFFGLLGRFTMYSGILWGLLHPRDWFSLWLNRSKKVETKVFRYNKIGSDILKK